MNMQEMEKYRDKLLEQRTSHIKEYRLTRNSMVDDVQTPGELSNVPSHNADADSEGFIPSAAMVSVQGEILREIDDALGRIDQGIYGQCVDCSAEISRSRLDALPHTPRCVECEKQHETVVGDTDAIEETTQYSPDES